MIFFSIVFKNVFNVGFYQGLTLILPLISLPLIWSALGISLFGQYVSVVSIASIFAAVVDYNYTSLGTLMLRNACDSVKKKKIVVSQIINVQLVLFFLTSIIFYFIALVSHFSVLESFLIFSGVTFQVVSPTWYFQGKSKFLLYSLINLILKIIQIVLIYYFVKDNNDYFYLAIIIFYTGFFNLFFGLLILFKEISYIFNIKYFKNIYLYLFRDRHFFFNSFSSGVLLNLTVYLAFMKFGNETAGVIGISDKILRVPLTLRNVIVQGVFPFVKTNFDRSSFFLKPSYIKKISYLSILVTFFITVFSLFFIEHFLYLFGLNININKLDLFILFLKFIFGTSSMILVYWYFVPNGFQYFTSKVSLWINGFSIIVVLLIFLIPIKLTPFLCVIPLSEILIFYILNKYIPNDK